jgi:peptidoglycan/xylan/chitin deacetylase (PgdA/CDA1 family)
MIKRTPVQCLLLILITVMMMAGCSRKTGKEKIVVLTFDDAVQSHLSYVAPLLKEKGFGATFFISHAWMNDTANFLDWPDVLSIYEMGFEIGNHSWTHKPLHSEAEIRKMKGNLARVDSALQTNGIPKPISFGYPGNHYSPGTAKKIRELGYRFARRGMQPEIPYGEIAHGPLFDPEKHNRLVIPTTADAYPEWTLAYFKTIIDRAEEGKAIILQFHGVPDKAHPWVHCPPDSFALFMDHLEESGHKVIALRDLDKYFDIGEVDDPALNYTYSAQGQY